MYEKSCLVCGDRATGNNFNAWSCESCKAFFRRNALRQKEWQCSFHNLCKIDKTTRRFCQKCRLMKCLSVGMKKELIMSDEDKQQKRNKRNKNSRTKLNGATSSPSGETTEIMSPSEPQTQFNTNSQNEPDVTFFGLGQELSNSFHLHCESRIDKYYKDQEIKTEFVNNDLEQKTDLNKLENVPLMMMASTKDESQARASTFQNPFMDSLTQQIAKVELMSETTKIKDHNLSELETKKLDELIEADAIVQSSFPRSPNLDPRNPSLIDIVKLTDHAIRKFINMSKSLTGFINLCREDQISLLKGGCPELMILRSVMAYNTENDSWQDSKHMTIMKLEILKMGSKGKQLYDKHKSFIDSFRNQRSDKNIMLILNAIVLFNPLRINVVHPSSIRLQQLSYMYLLKRYLESKSSNLCQAHSTYLELIFKIQELQSLNDDVVQLLIDANPGMLEPLLKEMFDLD